MVFLEERNILIEMSCEQFLDLVVIGLRADEIVPAKKPFGVRVDDKNGFVERVEQDRVRRLRTDAVDLQKLVPHLRQFLPRHRFQASMVFIKEKPHEILQTAGFNVKITGGFDERGELRDRDIAQGAPGEGSCRFQTMDGFLDVAPVRILGQDGADDDLELRPRRPPVLRAEFLGQLLVDSVKGFLCPSTVHGRRIINAGAF